MEGEVDGLGARATREVALFSAQEHERAGGIAAPRNDGAQPDVADVLADAEGRCAFASRRIAQDDGIDLRMRRQRIAERAEFGAEQLAAQVQLVAGDAQVHRPGESRQKEQREEGKLHASASSTRRSSSARCGVMRPTSSASGKERSASVQ